MRRIDYYIIGVAVVACLLIGACKEKKQDKPQGPAHYKTMVVSAHDVTIHVPTATTARAKSPLRDTNENLFIIALLSYTCIFWNSIFVKRRFLLHDVIMAR